MCYHKHGEGNRDPGVPGSLGPVAVWALVQGLERGGGGAGDDCARTAGPGNFSNVEGVGAGVFEIKIDVGPGYRVYFGKDGERIVVLLGGSAKKRQSAAIAAAQAAWVEYKRRKGGME